MRGSLNNNKPFLPPFFIGAFEPGLWMRFPFSACQNCVEEKEGGTREGQMPMGRARWCSHSLPPNAHGQESIMTPVRGKIGVSECICENTSEQNLVEFISIRNSSNGQETSMLREWALTRSSSLSRWYRRFPGPRRRCIRHLDLSRHNRSTAPAQFHLLLIAVGAKINIHNKQCNTALN